MRFFDGMCPEGRIWCLALTLIFVTVMTLIVKCDPCDASACEEWGERRGKHQKNMRMWDKEHSRSVPVERIERT